MDWLRDAHDTLDVVLTYGDIDDPLFNRIVTKYRDMAHDLGRADEFERVVREVLALRHRRHAEMQRQGG